MSVERLCQEDANSVMPMARKSDSRLAPPIKGERRLRNTPIRRRSDSVSFGVYNRAVHFGLSREHQAWKAPVRSFLSTALANSCRRHNQRGIGPRLDRSGSGPVVVVQHAA